MVTERYQTIQHSYYPTISTVTEVLTVIFCYCSYTLAAQIVTEVFVLSAAGLGLPRSSLSGGGGAWAIF